MYSVRGLLLLPQNRDLSTTSAIRAFDQSSARMKSFFRFVFTRYGTGRIDQNVTIVSLSLAYARLAFTLSSTIASVGMRSAGLRSAV